MPVYYLLNAHHVDRAPGEVDRHDDAGAFRYGCLNSIGVYVRILSNVGEDDSGPDKAIAAAEAKKELGAVMTSSPAPTPMERRTRCNEQVPFATPVANGGSNIVCELTLKSRHIRTLDVLPRVEYSVKCRTKILTDSSVLGAEVRVRNRKSAHQLSP